MNKFILLFATITMPLFLMGQTNTDSVQVEWQPGWESYKRSPLESVDCTPDVKEDHWICDIVVDGELTRGFRTSEPIFVGDMVTVVHRLTVRYIFTLDQQQTSNLKPEGYLP